MKKSKNRVLLFWLGIIVIGAYSFWQYGSRYLKKSFFDSYTFQSEYEDFTSQLGPLVLNPLNEDAKKEITVTNKEIENYRNYYGSLSKQIVNINDQYKDKVMEAKRAKATTVEKALIKERDQKIKDITKNFEDNAYVRAKIMKAKEAKIDQYISNVKKQKQDFLQQYNYLSYQLTDVKTGETFTLGNLKSPTLYAKTYNNQNLLSTKTIDSDSYQYNFNESSEEENQEVAVDSDLSSLNNKFHHYKGEVRVDKNAFMNSDDYQEYRNYHFHQILLIFIWILSLIALIVLVLYRPIKFTFNKEMPLLRMIRKWPIDVRAIGIVFMLFCLFLNLDFVSSQLALTNYINDTGFKIISSLVSVFLLYLLLWITVIQLVSLIEDMNSEEKRIAAYKRMACYLIVQDIQNLFSKLSVGLQSVALLVVLFLSGVGIVGAFYNGSLMMIYSVLFLTVALPTVIIFLSRMGYLNKIIQQTEDMAEGRYNSEIEVRGHSVLAKHAANLNRLRDGVRSSVTEQAKSERLKTELITNVSHDLRTPLTSIITYTDLLKNPDLTEDERNSYVAILDKKSLRLKTLIEDLFEVSKMASGNIELQKEKVNLNQLLQQALGEHEEDIERAPIEFRVQLSEEPLWAVVDGQKWWRVLDNLIVNTLKYTLEGTRVYISLERVGQNAQFVIKNVTKYELGNQNVEELFERFKRADTSRHTEGSGLGLAIAQSIVDLHNGQMDITVDGDLFKVTVNVPMLH